MCLSTRSLEVLNGYAVQVRYRTRRSSHWRAVLEVNLGSRPAINIVRSAQVRYLAVGMANTIVGYCLGVGLYNLLSPRFHILAIGAITNVFSISFSFAAHKLFVFRTQGRWLKEYFRSYVVYGGVAIIGIIALWILVDGLHMPIWLAQGLSICIGVVISYAGHSRFTFSPKKDVGNRQPK